MKLWEALKSGRRFRLIGNLTWMSPRDYEDDIINEYELEPEHEPTMPDPKAFGRWYLDYYDSMGMLPRPFEVYQFIKNFKEPTIRS